MELQEIFKSKVLLEIEQEIMNLESSEYFDIEDQVNIDLIQEEVDLCDFILRDIYSFLVKDTDLILKFIKKERLNVTEKSGYMGKGFSITYAIYLLYLVRDPEELIEYLRRRRLPDAKEFSEELSKCYKDIVGSVGR